MTPLLLPHRFTCHLSCEILRLCFFTSVNSMSVISRVYPESAFLRQYNVDMRILVFINLAYKIRQGIAIHSNVKEYFLYSILFSIKRYRIIYSQVTVGSSFSSMFSLLTLLLGLIGLSCFAFMSPFHLLFFWCVSLHTLQLNSFTTAEKKFS